MPTIVDALTAATAALNNAVQNVLGVYQQLQQAAATSQTAATTVINNFLTRPVVGIMYLDPANGNDSNDGSTPALAKKTFANLLATVGSNPTQLNLLSDLFLTQKHGVPCSLYIQGRQISSNGTIPAIRTISVQGIATNSPDNANNWTYGSGLFIGGAAFTSSYINWSLPDLPGGQTFTAALTAMAGITCTFQNGTLLVSSAAAGQLFQAVNAKGIVFSNLSLGTGAAGHLFQGIAAGADPNTLWQYDTNVTSG